MAPDDSLRPSRGGHGHDSVDPPEESGTEDHPQGFSRRRLLAATAGAALTPLWGAAAEAAPIRGRRQLGSVPSPPGDLSELGILAAVRQLRARHISAVELLAAVRKRIDAVNGGPPTFDGAPEAINAWIHLYPERALQRARDADRRLAREGGRAPLLCGVPVGVKDLISVAGLPVTASSRVLEDNVAASDAPVWARLEDQGMVLVGHTHTHEFAAGLTTDQVGNPWSTGLIVGGSSGGSAAALAARMVPAALGTDTGGSLRVPAAMCGVTSVKPTRGRISIDGIIPFGYTYDHVGPMARSAADCSALLAAMAGDDAQLIALAAPAAPLGAMPTSPRRGTKPLRGVRIAVTDRIDMTQIAADVTAGFERAIAALKRLGAKVVTLPAPAATVAAAAAADWFPVTRSDMWLYHRPLLATRRDRYRPSTLGFLAEESTLPTGEQYSAAQQRRDQLAAAWTQWFRKHNVAALVEPTTSYTPYPRFDGNRRYAFANTWDATGNPTVAMPSGLGPSSKLPVSICLVGQRGDEAGLLQIAIDLQEHELDPPRLPL